MGNKQIETGIRRESKNQGRIGFEAICGNRGHCDQRISASSILVDPSKPLTFIPNLHELKMSNQELSVVYFRDRVTSEVDRLQELCKKWQAIIDSKEDGDKVDEHERADDIRCAIGKATILISGRIRQFRSLIDGCERWEKEGDSTTEPERPKTKVTDLQGFWEMVSIQIADVDKLFQDLDKPKGEETTEAAGKKRSKSMEKPKSETTTPTSNVAKKRSASSATKASRKSLSPSAMNAKKATL